MIGDWDNLRVFLALAEEGNLTAAARRLRVSHPTIARRVKALEEELGTRLFDRLPDRFQPTEQALELLHDVKEMERASLSIDRRSAGLSASHLGTVRISVDETMAEFLARYLIELTANHRCIEFEIVVAHTYANLSRREADLLIRNRVPDLASLVGRKVATFAYAVYGTAEMAARSDGTRATLVELPWVGFDDEHQYMPGQAWQAALLGNGKPSVRTNNGVVLANAIRGGNGVGVLPCFIGDAEPGLRRITPVVAEAAAEQWMLVHNDLRNVPRVRIVMDALVQLFRAHRAEVEGTGAAPALAMSA
ncbi:MAG: LysR family transcriptional regulator [Thalassobaculum sp.]|uniref:LysR family transcriptional regulator n=1 Tax=Thalassobaculum sp. TaxID=2022740 RepID=UPI0032EE6121